MPNYTFMCEKCTHTFEVIRPIKEYKEQEECPVCKSSLNTHREYSLDSVTGRVALRTVGALADRNSQRISEDEKKSLQNKREGGMVELPSGMTRMRKNND